MTTISRPRFDLGYVTPNWFASVMGTGIVSVAVVGLPVSDTTFVPALRHGVGLLLWALALALLIAISAATVGHWLHHPEVARRHHLHPTMAHFYGAAPMALLTAGAATLLIGYRVIGAESAVALDWVLWTVGSLGGLTTFAVIPYFALTRQTATLADAFGGWLMPVVPPMVSASTGALLIPHTPVALRHSLLVACYLLFALSLAACVVIIPVVLHRMAVRGLGGHGRAPAAMVPTVWILLGPLGQSVAAANLLAAKAGLARADVAALHRFAVDYGVIVWSLASLWVAIAAVMTTTTARRGLPFTLTWWSFTFPMGTYVTGSAALWAQTGNLTFRASALGGFAVLVIAWTIVAARTVRGICTGVLLAAP
jgi:tellurite resistance protein TehA-like permease